MSNTSRFTPLYVTRMFIEMIYYSNKDLIIPDVLLECGPTYEDSLCQDLEEINEIANSGNTEKIIKHIRGTELLIDCSKYIELLITLFCFKEIDSFLCKNLNDFLLNI